MGFFGDAASFVVEEGLPEVFEGVPGIGAIPTLYEAGKETDEVHDAAAHRRLNEDNPEIVQQDRDREAYHDGQAQYDTLKAIPFLGTALSVDEMVSGGMSWAEGKKGGYEEGKNDFRDGALDVMDWVGGGGEMSNGDEKGLGSREALRHRVEADGPTPELPEPTY